MAVDALGIESNRRLGFHHGLFQVALAQVKRSQPEVQECIVRTGLRRGFEFFQRAVEVSLAE